MRKTWTMPRIGVDVFVPNEYAVACEDKADYARMWCPIKETNGITGWQQHNAPAGSHIDANGYAEEGWLKVYLGSYRLITVDDYDTDDTRDYYEVVAGPLGAKNEAGTLTYPAGAVFYKNYNGVSTDFEIIEKNRS